MNEPRRYQILNRDACKYLAIFLMFWGHLFGWRILMKQPDVGVPYNVMPLWMRIVTHFSIFCPPVMFFFVADGYKYTRDRRKYARRLGIFALITQPFDWLVFQPVYGWHTTNVIFTLFFGLLGIMAWESRCKTWQRVLLVALCCGLSLLLFSDWMIFGVLFILFLHGFREKPKARFTAYLSLTLLWLLTGFIGAEFNAGFWLDKALDLAMMLLAYFCMTTLYNGRKGRHPQFAKWFFYGFYPVHYLVIRIITMLT